MGERGQKAAVGCVLREVFDVYAATVCLTRSICVPNGIAERTAQQGQVYSRLLLCFFLEVSEWRCKSCWMVPCLRRDLFH